MKYPDLYIHSLTPMLLMVVLTFSSCAKQPYYINTYTDRDEVGNYVIRWEVRPGMDGKVEIYASDNAYSYPQQPAQIEKIGKQVTTYVTSDNVSRKYFMLVFEGRESIITGARSVLTDAVINMRDLGGYTNAYGEQVRWGMLYRSGELLGLSRRDSVQLRAFGFRNRIKLLNHSIPLQNVQRGRRLTTVSIPAGKETYPEELIAHIYEGHAGAGDVRNYYSELFQQYAYGNKKQFHDALMMMIDPSHYPILITDDLGKDRVAFLVMLIQQILHISQSDIIDEYLQSNQQLPVERIFPRGYTYPYSIQEALTEYVRCRANDMNNIIAELERHYGSVSEYLTKELDFGPERQERLRYILLD